jgi:hypothetical protein
MNQFRKKKYEIIAQRKMREYFGKWSESNRAGGPGVEGAHRCNHRPPAAAVTLVEFTTAAATP